MHYQDYIYLVVLMFLGHTTGQQYNLSGSSEYASLREPFTWTCEIFLPPNQVTYGAYFYRDNNRTALVGLVGKNCVNQSADPRYRYDCLKNNIYSLTIPGVNMTEFEQRSIWRCEYIFNSSYRSPDATLIIAIEVFNVSLNPSDNPITIREGTRSVVQCLINSNAVPTPTIIWYLASTEIRNMDGTDTTNITITGKRIDNNKTLKCSATNNNKTTKMASAALNIEYPPMVHVLPQQIITERRNLSVTCQANSGNPSSTTIYWTKVDNSGFRQNGSTLQLYNIQRSSSGTYRCTAENSYRNKEKGINSQNMTVNVFYPPMVSTLSDQYILEGRDLSVNCTVIPGNPSSTTIYWTKVDNSGFRQNGSTLQLSNIQRNSAGTYRCTAENSYSNKEKGNHSQNMRVDVQYPPLVYALSQQDIIEGRDLSVNCTVIPGNPSSTTIYWTRVDNQQFIQNGTTLQLSKIQRTSSGTYRCTAENSYNNGRKGTHNRSMLVNVQYQPFIENKPRTIVNESEKVFLSRTISSNPLSNASWYDGTELLQYQPSTRIANFTLERAACENTKNISLLADNGIVNPVNATVELIVNCKPRTYGKNISIGVTDATGIEFSSTIIAFPKPQYELHYENGTINIRMSNAVTTNAVYNFTIRYNQTIVNKDDYGKYHLRVNNPYGETIIYVDVIAQRKPDMPKINKVNCNTRGARLQWKSSFDGGDPQVFTVIGIKNQHEESESSNISDKGENEIHFTYLQNLQPSTTYIFYVTARNSHGFSTSENISCMTLGESSDNLPLTAGGAATGAIAFAIIVMVIIMLRRRYSKHEKQGGKSQRLNNVSENENDEADVDGLKENSLYVSAGPKDDERSEVAVYAAVAKKQSQSDNNSNLYADVKKSGGKEKKTLSSDDKTKKGLFKKDEKAKHKKGKKPKNRPGEIDVYENSEDIALATNTENVYSNAGQKGPHKQEEGGYKNKDGLLYVEVNFDGKQGQDNPVIHGEDEKTDYATVEFPMPSSVHKASGGEEL